MTELEIRNFIKLNEGEKLNLFFTNTIEKSKDIDKEINLLSLGMLLMILLYYLADFNIEGNFNIGPLEINDVSVLNFLIPLVFSFLLLKFVILSSHKAEIQKIVRVFIKEYFNYDNSNVDILYRDDFSRILLPVSIYDEINKFNLKTKAGCLSTLLILPLSLLIIAPYFLISLWVYPQITEFNSLEILNKISLATTIWVGLISIYYVVKSMKAGVENLE